MFYSTLRFARNAARWPPVAGSVVALPSPLRGSFNSLFEFRFETLPFRCTFMPLQQIPRQVYGYALTSGLRRNVSSNTLCRSILPRREHSAYLLYVTNLTKIHGHAGSRKVHPKIAKLPKRHTSANKKATSLAKCSQI